MLRGGRWSVIMLSMIQAEQTSHLSPYCNESVFRNSNYLFDWLRNDKNSSVAVDIPSHPPDAATQTYTHARTGHDRVEVMLTFNLCCHITSDSLPGSDLIICGSAKQILRLLHQPHSQHAFDIILNPDCVMDYILHLKWISGIFIEIWFYSTSSCSIYIHPDCHSRFKIV